MYKKIVNGLLNLLITSLILLALVGCGASATSINLEDYIVSNIQGYDTVGQAEYSIDIDALAADHGSELLEGYKKNSDNLTDNFDNYGITNYFINECVSLKPANFTDLSNGDEVTVNLTVNETLAKDKFNVNAESKEVKYVIEDLENLETVDPFDGVELILSGISPYGKAEIKNNKQDNKFNYKLEENNNLKEGETVTVKVTGFENDEISPEEFIEDGIILSQTSKDYKIEGLEYYMEDFSQLSGENFDSLNKESADKITAFVNQNWEDEWSLDETVYLQSYLLTKKSKDVLGPENKLVMVYKLTANLNYEDGLVTDKHEFYTCISYDDLVISGDKIIVDLVSGNMTRNSFTKKYDIPDSYARSYSFIGYESLEQLFNKEVGKYVGEYNYISTEEE